MTPPARFREWADHALAAFPIGEILPMPACDRASRLCLPYLRKVLMEHRGPAPARLCIPAVAIAPGGRRDLERPCVRVVARGIGLALRAVPAGAETPAPAVIAGSGAGGPGACGDACGSGAGGHRGAVVAGRGCYATAGAARGREVCVGDLAMAAAGMMRSAMGCGQQGWSHFGRRAGWCCTGWRMASRRGCWGWGSGRRGAAGTGRRDRVRGAAGAVRGGSPGGRRVLCRGVATGGVEGQRVIGCREAFSEFDTAYPDRLR